MGFGLLSVGAWARSDGLVGRRRSSRVRVTAPRPPLADRRDVACDRDVRLALTGDEPCSGRRRCGLGPIIAQPYDSASVTWPARRRTTALFEVADDAVADADEGGAVEVAVEQLAGGLRD